ncbi:MAG: hypothetical protein Ct9H300mP17_08010 [Candidatus Nitrosopelagicus sp.]|nr:MAG: hypothetical protein Ct9H300mP17_08010 [Candidatus Nitrosopelagicus sp.]
MAYSGEDRDGFITTFTISSDGSSITEVAGSILEHDTNRGAYNSLVHVDSDTMLWRIQVGRTSVSSPRLQLTVMESLLQ